MLEDLERIINILFLQSHANLSFNIQKKSEFRNGKGSVLIDLIRTRLIVFYLFFSFKMVFKFIILVAIQ